MKKFIKITAAILLLLFVSFWGYIGTKKMMSYNTPIHRDASSLVRIDVYAIAQSLLGDLFRLKREQQHSTLPGGLAIPANIFLYTIKGMAPSTLFCSLAINDYEAFQQSLPTAWTLTHHDKYELAQSPDGRCSIAFNKTRAAFAWSMKGEAVEAILSDLVLLQHILPVRGSPFKAIKELDGHITWSDGRNIAALTLGKGQARLTATGSVPGLQIPAIVQPRATASGAALRLWLYTDSSPFLTGRHFRTDSLSLVGDSLLVKQPGGIELTLSDPVVQRDSVVTYEYNEDFEKVATVSVKESRVPGLLVYYPTNASQIYGYLQRQHIIGDSGRISSAFFPLYQLYAKTGDGAMLFSTRKTAPMPQAGNRSTPCFFHLDADFDQLKKQPELAALLRYTRPYRKLEANAWKDKKGLIELEATLAFRDTQKQSLLQLIEVLQAR